MPGTFESAWHVIYAGTLFTRYLRTLVTIMVGFCQCNYKLKGDTIMSNRKVAFLKGEYYHIYNRGVDRQRIFYEDENYLFLLSKIKQCCNRDRISMIAYCLMPNHYHYLMQQKDIIPISHTVQAIFNSYSKAFNIKYHRTGTLFAGRFKRAHINSTEKLLYLCRYILRNPIDAKSPLVSRITDWPYSNLREWLGIRNGSLVERSFIDIHFENTNNYLDFLSDDNLHEDHKEFKEILFDYDIK